MNIQSARHILKLDAKGQSELIADITKELAKQNAENDRLKKLAEKAGRANTLWKTLTIAVSAIVGFSGAVLWFGGLWGDWVAVRNAHEFIQPNGQIVYDHRAISDVELAAIRIKLNIPEASDLSQYAKKSDMPNPVNLDGVVRYGDEIKLRYASNSSGMYLSSTDFNAVTGEKFGLWALEEQ